MTVDTSLFQDPMFPQPPLDNSPIGEWARSFVNSLREHQFGVVDGTRQQITQLESDYIAADASLEAGITIELGTLTTDVAAVASRVTTLESQVQTPTTGLLARVTITESTIATHDTAIATLNTTVGTHGTSITQLITDVDTVEARVTTTEANISTNATAISTLNGSVATLSTTVSSHTSSITTINSTLTTRARVWLQTSAPASGHQTGDLWLDSDDGYKVYRYNGSSWDAVPDARIATNAANIATNTTAITTLDGAVATLNTTVSAHTTSISTADALLTNITQSLAPSTFEQDGLFFTSDAGTEFPAVLSGTFTDVANIGRVYQATGITHILQRNLTTLIAGKTYRVTVKARITVDATNGYAPTPLVGVWIWSATAYLSAGYWISTFVSKAVADGWFTITGTFTLADLLGATPTAAKVRAGIAPGWNGSGTTDAVFQVSQVLFEDVTDITATNAVVVTNTANISTNASAITSLNGSVSSLSTTVSAHTSSISTLGTDLDAAEAAIVTANANISSNSTAITGLTSSIATTNSTVSANYASLGQRVGNAINSSPDFADNANATGVPTNWIDWANGSGTRVTGVGPQPYAFQLAGVAGNNSGIRQILDGRMAPGWYVIEADVELISGTFVGAGAFIYSVSSGGDQNLFISLYSDPDTSGTAPGNGSTGKIYRFRKLVQYTQTSPNAGWPALYAAPHWDFFGSIASANSIKWHRCAIRAASQAEVEARQATIDLVTANATISSHTSSIASNTSAISTLTTSVSARFTADQKNSQNMLRNSTFRNTLHWTFGSSILSGQTYTDHIYAYIGYVGGYRNIYQDVRVEVGAQYAFSGDIYSDNGNNARLYVQLLNEARNTHISYPAVLETYADNAGWRHVTAESLAVVPSGAAWARIYCDNYPGTGGTAGGAAFRRIKFERGTFCTAWSEDDGALGANEVAANLVTTDATVSSHTSSIATNTSAISSLSSTVSANYASLGQRVGNAINPSPDFADNTNATGLPTNWGDWSWGGTDGVRVTGLAPQPYAYQQAGRAGDASGIAQQLLGKVTAGWHVLEADVTLVSGALTGSGAYTDWDGGGTGVGFATEPDITGSVIGAGTTGRLYKFRKLVQVTLGSTYQNLYAMSHWAGFGSVASANNITWHRCALRPASQAEIEARTATNDLVTANATISSHTSSIASNASSISTLSTTVTANYTALRSGGTAEALPSTFDKDDLYWNLSGGFASQAGIGRVFRATAASHAARSRQRLTLRPGRTYRLTARYGVQVNSTSGDNPQPLAGITTWNSSGANVSGIWVGSFVARTTSDGWVTVTGDYSTTTILGVDSTAVEIDSYCQPNWHPSGSPNATVDVQFVELKDVTDIVATNATVATNTSAISTINGAAAFWETVVSASGGDLAAVRLRAGTGGAYLELISTVLRLANVSNGAVIEVMRATSGEAYFSRPISSDGGGERLTVGPGYGSSGAEVVLWFGPDSIAPSSQSRTNGYFALGTDGEIYYGSAVLDAGIDAAMKTGTANFDNVTTSGTTLATMATIDLTVGSGGYLELMSPLFYGPLSISAETGLTLSSGTDWYGSLIITEQLQSGGTEYTLWTLPIQISDTGGGFFDFIFDPPVNPLVAQSVSGASRYRIKIQRTSGSNNISGNGIQGVFTIRRTP